MLEQLNIYRERIKRLQELMNMRISVEISDSDENLSERTKIIETWHNSIDERFHRVEFTVNDLKNVNRKLYDKIRYKEGKDEKDEYSKFNAF